MIYCVIFGLSPKKNMHFFEIKNTFLLDKLEKNTEI